MALLKTEVPRFAPGESLGARVNRMYRYLQDLQRGLDFVLSHLGAENLNGNGFALPVLSADGKEALGSLGAAGDGVGLTNGRWGLRVTGAGIEVTEDGRTWGPLETGEAPDLSGFAPTDHAAAETTYGIARAGVYGHVAFTAGLGVRGAAAPPTGTGLAGSAYQVWFGIQEALKATYNSGWRTFSLTSAFASYDATHILKYRRIGNVVELVGQIKPAAEVASGSTARIGYLPAGFWPMERTCALQQGSSKNSWMLYISEADGECVFSRYGTTAYAAATTSAWLPIHITFTTDNDIPSA